MVLVKFGESLVTVNYSLRRFGALKSTFGEGFELYFLKGLKEASKQALLRRGSN